MAELKVTILDERARFLAGRAVNYTSQFGEDGLIQALFETIGETNRWAFEIGAADGVFYSNTRRLFDSGWGGLLIEGDPALFARLEHNRHKHVQILNQWVRHNDLDAALIWASAPLVPDFGVIDIDGQDYWMWHELKEYKPRVMLVEFSPYGTPDAMPVLRGEGQAGLNSILKLGREKGYTALCHTYCNVLFCETSEWDRAVLKQVEEIPDEEVKPRRGAAKATRLSKH